MEIALLLILIILFIIFINSLHKKVDRLQDHFYDVITRLDHYKKLAENQQPIASKKEETVEKQPAPTPPPINVVRENPVPPPVAKPVFEEQKIAAPAPRVAAINAPPVAPQPKIQLPPEKSWWENFKEQNPDLEKFIGENLINKIGILILVLGISYFVKFAIDKDWINEPARVGIGFLAGGIVMLVAHKLRINYKAFSSVLVAGAISIFYFTIAIAFHEYHLFSQTVAFIIMVAITAFAAFISISYNRMELAALTLIGGFGVPFMVSTGSGNYVVLLTYIAILNVGILLIAYYKKWNLINLLAYIFTVLLYGSWLFTVIGEENASYAGALVYGFIYYLIFILTNVINNVRHKTAFSNMQLSILVSNTFLFYTAGMMILSYWQPQLKGAFTLLLGVFNFCLAWVLYKKLAMDQKIVYIFIGLTLTFVTLAIPIQFEGNYITLFWAAEAVLLMWLAQKSAIQSFRFGSGIVQALMLVSLIMDWFILYGNTDTLRIIINPAFITSVFSIASCVGVLLLLKRDEPVYELYGMKFNVKNYSGVLKLFTILLAYLTGFIELDYQAGYYLESSVAVYGLILLYHLLFSILFIQLFCVGKSDRAKKLGTILGIINIASFILLFSKLAYFEITDYITYNITSRLGYWLHFLQVAAVLYTAWIIYKLNREKVTINLKRRSVLPWLSVFLLVYMASSELMLHWLAISLDPIKNISTEGAYNSGAIQAIDGMRSQVIKTGYPVLWGVIACLLLLLGIKQQMKNIRVAALILLGLTIAKLFLYDIRNASETGKIIAFILLGVLILVISFVYQKIKLLVIEDKTELNTNNDETV